MKLFTPKKKDSFFFSKFFALKKSTHPTVSELEKVASNYSQKLFETIDFTLPTANEYLKEMRFNRIIEFNSSSSILKKLYGQAAYRSTAIDQKDLQIFIYNTRVRGVKSTSTLVYFKDKLIHFNYHFKNLSKQESIRVQNYLFYKYNLISKNKEEIIVDKHKNILKTVKKENSYELNFYNFELKNSSYFKEVPHTETYKTHSKQLNLDVSY